MPNKYTAHEALVNEILRVLGSRPEFRVWTNRNGYAVPLHGEHPMWFGTVEGAADISGIIKGSGVRLEIEVKSGSGRLSKAQINFRNMILLFGGVFIEARSIEQVLSEALGAYERSRRD